MVSRPNKPVEDTQREIHAATVKLSQDLARFPTPMQVCIAAGISRTALARHLPAMETAGMIRRVYGGRALEALPWPATNETT